MPQCSSTKLSPYFMTDWLEALLRHCYNNQNIEILNLDCLKYLDVGISLFFMVHWPRGYRDKRSRSKSDQGLYGSEYEGKKVQKSASVRQCNFIPGSEGNI